MALTSHAEGARLVFVSKQLLPLLLAGRPVFAGTSESDQLFKIVSALGAPKPSDWPAATALASAQGVRFPDMARAGMAAVIPRASPSAVAAIEAMLAWDPARRCGGGSGGSSAGCALGCYTRLFVAHTRLFVAHAQAHCRPVPGASVASRRPRAARARLGAFAASRRGRAVPRRRGGGQRRAAGAWRGRAAAIRLPHPAPLLTRPRRPWHSPLPGRCPQSTAWRGDRWRASGTARM